jgi:ribosomal-protein-alanine N-acetyltransferase
MHIVFETARLILRRFTTADAALILQLNSDPEIVRYVHERVLTSEEDAARVLDDIILPQYEKQLGRWAVHVKDNMEFIGWCGLKYRPERDENDLGYRFMQKAWGKGYATEAAGETLSHGFNELGLQEITGRSHIENLASTRVLEKIGMRFIGEGILDDCPVRTYVLDSTSFKSLSQY